MGADETEQERRGQRSLGNRKRSFPPQGTFCVGSCEGEIWKETRRFQPPFGELCIPEQGASLSRAQRCRLGSWVLRPLPPGRSGASLSSSGMSAIDRIIEHQHLLSACHVGNPLHTRARAHPHTHIHGCHYCYCRRCCWVNPKLLSAISLRETGEAGEGRMTQSSAHISPSSLLGRDTEQASPCSTRNSQMHLSVTLHMGLTACFPAL